MRSSAASLRTRSRCVVVERADEVVVAPSGRPRRCQRTSAVSTVIAVGVKPRSRPWWTRYAACRSWPSWATCSPMSWRSARVLEQLAVVVVEAVQLAELVEELEREARDVAGVLLGPRAAAGERLHRRAADRERVVGPVGRVVAADRVEHDALAERPLADGHLLDLEELHRDAR